jgi:SAM-dependent methyltransferase
MYEMENRHWWFRGRRSVIWALLGQAGLGQDPRLLDAGCGTGRNLVEFGSLGPSKGVDPSAEAVELCRKRGLNDVQCAGVEDLPFDSGEFDLLLACDVLEHVQDDGVALKELLRVADVGANLIITAPAYQWLWTDHDVQLHHFRRYTMATMRTRVTRAGWDVVFATYFNSILLPAVAAARVLSRGKSRNGHTDLDRTPDLLNGLLGQPMKLEAVALRHGARFPAGISLGLVCRKER